MVPHTSPGLVIWKTLVLRVSALTHWFPMVVGLGAVAFLCTAQPAPALRTSRIGGSVLGGAGEAGPLDMPFTDSRTGEGAAMLVGLTAPDLVPFFSHELKAIQP